MYLTDRGASRALNYARLTSESDSSIDYFLLILAPQDLAHVFRQPCNFYSILYLLPPLSPFQVFSFVPMICSIKYIVIV